MDYDFGINIDDLDIDIDFDLPMAENGFKTRYIKSKIQKNLSENKIKFDNAKKLAKDIDLGEGERYDVLLSGNFIFGDFIEAFIIRNNIKCIEMTISTLSLDQNNIDSLNNLLTNNYVDKLNLIISDYFYAHERSSLIPYIYDKLDIDDKFQLASAGTHTKIIMLETLGGKKIVIHGSANLRSSSNIEQITIEENKQLYDFHFKYHNAIIEKYKTINKDVKKYTSLRANKLWDVITTNK